MTSVAYLFGPGVFNLVNCLLSVVRGIDLGENKAASNVSRSLAIKAHIL